MSERLNDLQRQRALILEQLAWLDREIAAAAGEPPQAKKASTSTAPPAAPAFAPAAAEREAEAIIAEFGAGSHNPVESARRGCFIIFGLALLLLGLGIYGFYLYYRGRH